MFFISDFLNLYSTRYISEFDLENEDNDDDDKSTTNNERHKEIARNEQKKKTLLLFKIQNTNTHHQGTGTSSIYKKEGKEKTEI